MAKLTLNTIASGYGSNTALNENFDLIEEALEKTLSRDGTTPNSMSTDLDMNGHLILNSGNAVQVSGFTWEGPWVTGATYSIGDIVENNGTAYMCIVAHTAGTFATDLAAAKWQTFASAAVPTQTGNANKFLQTDGASLSWQVPDSAEISHTPSGSGAVATTVQQQLRNIQSFVVNVKDAPYYATGDGSTDDTDAFQAAIDDVLASPHKALYVPAGSYYVPTGLTVAGTSADRFVMYGDGRSSYIFSDSNSAPTIDLYGLVGNSFQHPTIRNCAIYNTHASGIAVKTRWTEFLKLEGNVISGGSVGLQMSITATEFDIKPRIKDNLFSGGAYGIRGGDTRVADAWIIDNLFLNNTSYCMEFGVLDGGTIRGNKLFSDNGAANALKGVNLKKPIYVHITENEFYELGGNALYITSPRYCRIRDNFIVGVGDNANLAAIYVTDFDNSVAAIDNQITGNTIKDVGGHGIQVESAYTTHLDYLIADNTIEGAGTGAVIYDAINLNNLGKSTVKGNKIDGNSATRYWLYLDGPTEILLKDNEHKECVNTDLYRTNSPTIVIPRGARITTGVTADTTLLFDDDGLISGTMTAGFTVTLPSATSCPGKVYTIVKGDAGAFSITVDASGAQTIDGALTLVISTQYAAQEIMSDGTQWITL